MDPILVSSIAIVVLFLFILLGVHIATAMIVVTMAGLLMICGSTPIPMSILGITAYRGVMEYIFGTCPLFIIMGLLANLSGTSKDLYDAANVLFRRIRGGIAIATVIANAIFASITGISVASAAVFSKIAVPQMKRLGYDKKFSLGTVAGSSILGMLIPPSMLLILYGILTEQAIGKLFIAGILPGVLMSLIFSIGILLIVRIRPDIAGRLIERTNVDKVTHLKIMLRPWPVLFIVFIVLGGIYLGFVTPTEAAAVGAAGALLVTIFKKRFTLRAFWEILLETGNMAAALVFLMISALFFSRFLTFSGFTAAITQLVVSLELSPIIVIWAFILIMVLLGSFLDSTSIMLIGMPILSPIVAALGFDLIWFGIVCVVAIETGLLTPPFGMVVFAMKAAMGEEVKVEEIFIGSLPFFLMMLIALGILVYVPWLSIWLPGQM